MKKAFAILILTLTLSASAICAPNPTGNKLSEPLGAKAPISLRAYGDSYLSDHYQLTPVCSNEGSLSFTPNSSGDDYAPIEGPDYWCRGNDGNLAIVESLIYYPSFFFFKISKSGDLILKISQEDSDVDYIIWGPFTTSNVKLSDLSGDKIDTRIITVGTWTEDNYDLPNCYTCSVSTRTTEYARIDNAQEGEYYILMISNYGLSSNPISITYADGNTAETDCSIVTECSLQDMQISYSDVYTQNATVYFNINGSIVFYNAPDTGTLTISDNISGKSVSFSAPFSSPLTFEIDSIPLSTDDERSLSASFSDSDCNSEFSFENIIVEEFILSVQVTDNIVCEVGDSTSCNGSATALVRGGVAPYTYLWSNNETSASISNLCSGTYTLTVTDDTGESIEASITIADTEIFDTSELNIVGDDNICQGEQVQLSVSGAPDGSSYLWTGCNADGQTGSIVSVSPDSTCTIGVSISNSGCNINLEYIVNVNPLPELYVESVIKPTLTELNVSADNGTSPYTYILDNSLTSFDGYFSNISKGYHSISVTDAVDCSADTTVFIDIKLIPDKFFSPNGDGVNDLWEIENIDLIPSRVFIYDSFGRLLIKYDEDFAGWDGTYNGHQMPSADYWYIIQEKATGEKMSGHFTLHRGKTN